MSLLNRAAGGIEPPLEKVYEDKVFRLIYFIHGYLNDEERRKVAFEFAKKASRWLHSITREQGKKTYSLKGQVYRSEEEDSEYRKKGKVKSKITLKEINMLQCRVFEESEKIERAQEEGDSPIPLNQEDMLVRYLAYLVRYTMKHTCFYVNLGLCRFVYDYDTGETEGLYSLVIQDSPNRAKIAEYFRKIKGTMKQELEERFGARLNTVTGKRGKKYFQRVEEPEQFSDLLKQCLDEFQPWEVKCCLPERFNVNDKIPELSSDSQKDKDDDSDVELNRMHSLLHPDCFVRLVRAKRYEEPEKRIALPLFFNGNRTVD